MRLRRGRGWGVILYTSPEGVGRGARRVASRGRDYRAHRDVVSGAVLLEHNERWWITSGELANPVAKRELPGKNVMLCPWWNSRGVVHVCWNQAKLSPRRCARSSLLEYKMCLAVKELKQTSYKLAAWQCKASHRKSRSSENRETWLDRFAQSTIQPRHWPIRPPHNPLDAARLGWEKVADYDGFRIWMNLLELISLKIGFTPCVYVCEGLLIIVKSIMLNKVWS